ncbi:MULTISPECIES: hypothetical protein [unclassified Paraburkholderia]|uniref:hypothetical protein n=1 Tax=unclassified Paraburkholderia TaxID=2615204 RepID=UPI002AAF2E22|nr:MULTISPECIES: hypothetical protein [unclassified Paraburkholderia]
MQIDLREIQALHARYAREPVVIDLEAQLRARPAPLLLAHDPNVKTSGASPLRRVWKARGSLGRGALMIVGGTALSAAIGMGAARLWATVHHDHAAPIQPASSQHASDKPSPQIGNAPEDGQDASPDDAARPLTSQDLGTPARATGALASVDPSALLRPAPLASPQNTVRPDAATDEQRAIASPVRQHVLERLAQASAPTVAPMHIAPPAAAATAAPAATVKASPAAAKAPEPAAPDQLASAASTRHAIRHRAPVARQPAPTADPKAPSVQTPGAAPHGGDVQLF